MKPATSTFFPGNLPVAVLLLVLGLAAAGCTSPQKRAEERATAFEKLSKDEQRLVLEGQIGKGMNEDAVYIALGKPNRIREGNVDGTAETYWMYGRIYTEPLAGTAQVMPLDNGRYGVYDPPVDYRTYYVDTFQVTFRGGQVWGWREL